MANLCLECAEKLYGRSDKKFCDDQCRNSFNNRLNSDSNNYMRKINNILRKNYRTLKKLNPKGMSKTHREKLYEEGFNFNYFTSTYTTKQNKTYFYCYDQGYIELEEGMYALVEKKEYLS